MNTAELDDAYKGFLKVRQDWIATLGKHAIYIDQADGSEINRPVAVVNDSTTMEHLKHLLVDWQRFHDLAEKYRENKISPIPVSMYAPVPFFAPTCDFVAVAINPAANTTKWYREKVISTIQKQLKIICRAKGIRYSSAMSTAADASQITDDDILLLENDLSRFMAFPEGTRFIRRQDGYSDVMLKLKDQVSQADVATPAAIFNGFVERDSLRVSNYGCVIDGRALKFEVVLHDTTGVNAPRNIYAGLTPIPCSALAANASLFLETDVEKAKAQAKVRSEEAKKDVRRLYAHRSRKRAAERAGKGDAWVDRDEPVTPSREHRRMNLTDNAIPIVRK